MSMGEKTVTITKAFTFGVAAIALASCAANAQDGQLRTPEGALLDTNPDLAYAPGALSEDQLNGTAIHLFRQDSMNVFRRFPRDMTEQMVNFYVNALALRSLNPIQLTSTQQMILTGVGTGQVKLSAGQQGNRNYDLSGGVKGGTGIRFLRFTYPDEEVVRQRFIDAGLEAPEFQTIGRLERGAVVVDPAGLTIQIIVRPVAADHSDDGVGIGVATTDLLASRDFYRDFVGLHESTAGRDRLLDISPWTYTHGETTILLYEIDEGLLADTGSSGIQYVVSDAPFVAAMADHRDVPVETPLNRLTGFDLTTIWLNDPNGVTNYFAQVGPRTPPITEAD